MVAGSGGDCGGGIWGGGLARGEAGGWHVVVMLCWLHSKEDVVLVFGG